MDIFSIGITTEEDKVKYYNYKVKDTDIVLGCSFPRKSPTIQCSNVDLDKLSMKEWSEILRKGAKYVEEINLPIDTENALTLYAIIGLCVKYIGENFWKQSNLTWVMDIVWIDDVLVDFISLFPMHKYAHIVDARDFDRYMMFVGKKIIETCIKFNYFEEGFDKVIPRFSF